MALSEQIATHRKTLKISGSEAARRAGVHRLTWRAWEKGEADPEEHNWPRIEQVLGWAPGDVARIRNEGKAPTRQATFEARVAAEQARLVNASMEDLLRARAFILEVRGQQEADRFLRDALQLQHDAQEQQDHQRRQTGHGA